MDFKLTIEGDENELQMYLNAGKMSAAIFELKYNTLRSYMKGYWPEHIQKLIGDDKDKQELAEEIFDTIDKAIRAELKDV